MRNEGAASRPPTAKGFLTAPECRGPTKQVRATFAISGSEPLAKQCTCRELRYDRGRGSDDGDCARKNQRSGGAVQQPRRASPGAVWLGSERWVRPRVQRP